MKQWRWSLIDPTTGNQESGQQFDLRQAMTDVAVKVENMVDSHEYEGQENGWKN